MIYIRAGLFAEGPTDYEILLPLLDRLLDQLAAQLFPGAYEVAPATGIDAPRGTEGGRAEKIAAAIHETWDECTLFVIHADGAGNPAEARRNCVEPGIAAALAARPERPVVAAACIPVREIEACWSKVACGARRSGSTPSSVSASASKRCVPSRHSRLSGWSCSGRSASWPSPRRQDEAPARASRLPPVEGSPAHPPVRSPRPARSASSSHHMAC